MEKLSPGFRILSLFMALLVGQILAGAATVLVAGLYSGGEFSASEGMLDGMSLAGVRWVIALGQIMGFLIPGLILIRWWGLSLPKIFHHKSKLWVLPAVILAYFISLPLFSWMFLWNISWEVPLWWPFEIEAVPEQLLSVLDSPSLWALLANLFVIGLIPSVGEEIVFRGLLQPTLRESIGSDFFGILVTAIIFSAIHLDFQGLMPRFLLGMILGLAYYYTRSLWWPIIIHFIHNGGQVLLSYTVDDFLEAPSSQDMSSLGMLPLISALALLVLYGIIHKKGHL